MKNWKSYKKCKRNPTHPVHAIVIPIISIVFLISLTQYIPVAQARGEKDTVAQLKTRIQDLEKEKSRTESTLSDKITSLIYREKVLREELEEIKKLNKLREKTLRNQLEELEQSKSNSIVKLKKEIEKLKKDLKKYTNNQ